LSGGVQSIGGSFALGRGSGTIVSDGGKQILGYSGIANDTTVLSGGTIVFEGGTANRLVVSSGGTALVDRAATLQVTSSDVIASVVVSADAHLIFAGRTVESVVWRAGASATIAAKATQSGLVLGSNTQLFVSSKGKALATVISRGGSEYLSAGAVDSGATIMKGGSASVMGGTAGRRSSAAMDWQPIRKSSRVERSFSVGDRWNTFRSPAAAPSISAS
jgi:autotransporter passenger strand-loop-strand repeat protein